MRCWRVLEFRRVLFRSVVGGPCCVGQRPAECADPFGGQLDAHGRSVSTPPPAASRRPQDDRRSRGPPDRVSTPSTGAVHRSWTERPGTYAARVPIRGDDRERGSTLPFVLVCWLVAALMVLVAIAASDAFLEQQEVQAVCDGAALAAANRADEVAAYAGGIGTGLPLSRSSAQEAVADQLESGRSALDTWSAETDGTEVTLRCTRF